MFEKFREAFDNYFIRNYHLIIVTSISISLIVGFFHYELKYNDHDILHWYEEIHRLYTEYEYVFLITTAIVIGSKILMSLLMLSINVGPMEWFDDLSRLEVQKRYADFLFIRLVSEISHIKEAKLRAKAIVSITSFIEAHERITERIEKFRQDARKVLAPSEIDMTLPPEEVFYIEFEQIDKKFAHLTVESDQLQNLVNP